MNMHATLTTSKTSALANKAMLASLKIKQWSGRKLDKEVTAETNRDHGAAADAGRYNKLLIGREALAPIVAIANRARSEHYARTLAWADDGARILSAVGYLPYMETMRGLRIEFDAATAVFVASYERHVEEAKTRLNGMFKAADYDSVDAMAKRFGFDKKILPMPSAADFRVDIGDAEADRIRADIEADMNAAVTEAMRDVFQRVADCVKHMAEKLAESRQTDKGAAPAIFRDSLVENVRELVALLPSLNITGDAVLGQIADRMGALCKYDASALRDDKGARDEVAKAAASILADVSDYMA